MDVIKGKSKIFSWPIFLSSRNLAKDNFLFKYSMTVNIHLTPAPWNFLAMAKKDIFFSFVLSWGDFFYQDMVYILHITWSAQGVLARHEAREAQGPEPGFASIRPLAQVNSVGTHSAQGWAR